MFDQIVDDLLKFVKHVGDIVVYFFFLYLHLPLL